jgi:hypothetical protein
MEAAGVQRQSSVIEHAAQAVESVHLQPGVGKQVYTESARE